MILRIVATLPITAIDSDDDPGWAWDDKKIFTVKSASRSLQRQDSVHDGDLWKHLWHYRGLPRLKNLLLLVCKGKLLTNLERFRWSIAPNENCPWCPNTADMC